MNRNTPTSAGFTLLELLIAITLLAALAAGGLHSWTGYRQALRLEQEALQVVAYLQRVQASANWRNDIVQVNLIQEGTTWCLRDGKQATLPCQQPEGGSFIPKAHDVQLAATTSRTLAFYGVRNAAQTGHLVLENGAGRLRVVISVWGRMRLCSDTRLVLAHPLC